MIVKDPVGDFLDIFHTPYKKSGPFLAKVHLEWVHFSLQVSRLLILEKGGGAWGVGRVSNINMVLTVLVCHPTNLLRW